MNEESIRPIRIYSYGIISLITVIMIIIYSCFALLSYVSAQSEYALSEKAAQSVKTYYAGESEAMDILYELCDNIKAGKPDKAKKLCDSLKKSGSIYEVKISVKLDENRRIILEGNINGSGELINYKSLHTQLVADAAPANSLPIE